MKLISWNIDSLNAALTSDSARALLSRDVLKKLAGMDADIIALQETKLSAKGPTKKHIECLEEIFPAYDQFGGHLWSLQERAMLVLCFCIGRAWK